LDSSSIGSNQVNCIFEDNAGRLWVGCENGGLCSLDRETDRFTRYYFQDSVYGSAAYDYVSSLKKRKRQITSILNVGDNARETKGFILKKKTDILLVVMGEGSTDYGWLENNQGRIIVRSDSVKTFSAGGRSDNRVLMSTLALDVGEYCIRYKSDDIHSYAKWSGEAPFRPEFWGVQVFDISGEVEKTGEMLNTLQPRNMSTRVRAMIGDHQSGNLLVAIGQPGLWSFDVNTRTFSKVKHTSDDHVISRGTPHAFLRARNGTLWIASTLGLTRFDPTTNNSASYQVVPSTRYVEENNFRSLLEDETGLIWVGHYVAPSLECFDPTTELFRRYAHDADDPFSPSFSFGINAVYKDRSGILWVGTWTGGLDKWDRKKKRFNTVEHDPGFVLASGGFGSIPIHEDSAGGILIGTDEGVVPLRRGKYNRFPLPYSRDEHHKRNRISAIIEDPVEHGVLWIGSKDSGLVRFDYKKGRTTHHRNDPRDTGSLSSNFVWSIRIDHEGALWIGTDAGLNRFNRATRGFSRFRHDPNDPGSISQDQILGIYEDRAKVLWFGTNLGGMNRFDRSTGKFMSWKSLIPGREFTTSVVFCEDRQGNFWVGDYMSGLHLFDRDKGKSIRDFTEKDGLANNTVQAIVEDDSGHLWISTLNGLSRFDPRTPAFKNFWIEDGLLDNSFLGSHLKTRDGRIILGTRKGLVAFHPDSIRDDPVPPQVVISNVYLFNRSDERLALNGYVPELSEIDLSHSQNDLRFDFVGLQFSEPARNRYKYMLENFDRTWVDAGTQRNATYTNLDPGEYTFKVKAANRDGIWNEQGASIRIVITPPWWKTVWAYLGYSLGIVGLLYSVRRSEKKRDRMKQQAEIERVESEKRLQQEFSKQLIETQEAERKRVASELHDSLGQHLLVVNNELQLSLQGRQFVESDIQRTVAIVKDAIKEVREIASNLHPHHLEKLGLRAAVEAMIEQISRSATVRFDAEIEDVDSALSMPAKINLYRILQEAIANIVRHSGATQASITVSRTDNTVQATVEDNGKGFTSNTSQTGREGFGLKSMTERVNLIGGTITYDSSPGKGTMIQIIIPC
jgi:signal transduction histidine kinase/ligand-binding sensor domain-containing protein